MANTYCMYKSTCMFINNKHIFAYRSVLLYLIPCKLNEDRDMPIKFKSLCIPLLRESMYVLYLFMYSNLIGNINLKDLKTILIRRKETFKKVSLRHRSSVSLQLQYKMVLTRKPG